MSFSDYRLVSLESKPDFFQFVSPSYTVAFFSLLFKTQQILLFFLFIQSHWKQHQWSSCSCTSLETLAWLDVIPLQSLLFTSPYSSALPNKTVFRSSKCSTAKLPSKDVYSVVVTFDWWNGVADKSSCLALARSSELLSTLCHNVVFAWGLHWSHGGSLWRCWWDIMFNRLLFSEFII